MAAPIGPGAVFNGSYGVGHSDPWHGANPAGPPQQEGLPLAEPGTAGAPAGADRWNSGPLPDLHPGVQQFAYADANGGGGNGKGGGTGNGGTTKSPPKIDKCHALTPPPAKSHFTAKPSEVYDVATTNQATIDKLKGSDDAATRRLGRTIENAKANYADLLPPLNKDKVPAKIIVKLSDGNGGQPVMVLTGPGFDPKGHVRVHTHYHGDNATVADPLGSKAGTNARIRDAIARDKQTVFVLPEADNTREGTDSPHNDGACDYTNVGWRNVKSQDATTEDALKARNVTGTVDERVVSLHSGAGKLVPRLMGVDKTGAGLRCDRLELLDSLYGNSKHDWKTGPDLYGWEQGIKQWAKTANGQAVKQVVYYHGTNDDRRARTVEQAFAGRNVYVAVDTGAKSANPIYTDAAGQTYKRTEYGRNKDGKPISWKVDVRQYEDNAHYRATGQYLGANPPPLPPKPAPLTHEPVHGRGARKP